MTDNIILWCIFVFLLTSVIYMIVLKVTDSEYFGQNACVNPIPFSDYKKFKIKKDTIFVSIASYRDYECSDTVDSIFKNAKNPQNIFVGICEQNMDNETDEQCITTDNIRYLKNIRVKRLDYSNAKGPTYARYWCSQLWEGEEYFLQIDSHTTFAKDWDSDLIEMIQLAKEESNRPVLSSYPPTKEQMTLSGFPEFDFAKINDNKIPMLYCGWSSESDRPKRSNKPWTSAGFMFLESKFLYDVPFDPNLSHLFQLEEMLFSARLFTCGWNFYTPNKKICYHHYARKESPMYYKDNASVHGDCRTKAEKRGLYILGVVKKDDVQDEFLVDIDKYGLGKLRTMSDFWNASGIDFNNKTVEKWNDATEPSNKYKGWCFRRDGFKKIKKF